jgi:hypothetical protein
MKSTNIIELNGKLYDAKTGAQLKKSTTPKAVATPTPQPPVSVAKKRPLPQTPKSIDGFTPRRKATPSVAKLAPVPVKKPLPVTPGTAAAARKPASNIKQAIKRSQTLNRSVVTAPNLAVRSSKDQPTTDTESLTSSALKHADSTRLNRAKHIAQSQVISKFGEAAKASAPHKAADKPHKNLTDHLAAAQTAAVDEHTAIQRQSTKERLIKKALDSAVQTSPAQPLSKKAQKSLAKKRSPRSFKARYASTAFAALLLAAYVAYLNIPSISMKVAAHRAGFAASLPSYKPSGYSLRGPIAYSPGQVTLNFASNTDQRKFALKQQPTTWDSTALLENFVTKKSANYLTYQDSGLTIYIIDGTSAAWVNGGKLYHVEGENSQLDTDQLLKLATSV